MSRRAVFLTSSVWLVLALFTSYEIRTVQRGRAQTDALARRVRQLEAEARSVQAQRDATLRELTEAERQLAALPEPKPDDKTLPARQRAEISAWLAKVKRLRGLFEARPDQRIPEMQLLTEDDWLRTAKVANLDGDENSREAMAQVRSAAIGAFQNRLRPALRRYLKEVGADRPADTQALGPYFESPADAALLDRYEIVDRSSSLHGAGANWGVQNRSPVDAAYDMRSQVSAMGSTSNSGPLAWDPTLSARYNQALRSYTKANQGDYPKSMADAVPFFDPPLDQETAERLIRTDRRRN